MEPYTRPAGFMNNRMEEIARFLSEKGITDFELKLVLTLKGDTYSIEKEEACADNGFAQFFTQQNNNLIDAINSGNKELVLSLNSWY